MVLCVFLSNGTMNLFTVTPKLCGLGIQTSTDLSYQLLKLHCTKI